MKFTSVNICFIGLVLKDVLKSCKTIEFSIIQRENTFVVPTRVTCLEAFSSGVPPVVFTAKVYIVLEWAVSNEFIPK